MDSGRSPPNSPNADERTMDEDLVGEGSTDRGIADAMQDSIRRGNDSFKVRLGKTSTSVPYQQSIPIGFAKRYKSLHGQRITLEGPTGKTWTVMLRAFPNRVCFSKSWRYFSIDNHLQQGYEIMFTFVGKSRFVVDFFDRQGKRCTSYPPIPAATPALAHELGDGGASRVAETSSRAFTTDDEETGEFDEPDNYSSESSDMFQPPATKQTRAQTKRNKQHFQSKKRSRWQNTGVRTRESPTPRQPPRRPPPPTPDNIESLSSDDELPIQESRFDLQETRPVRRMKISVPGPPAPSLHAAAASTSRGSPAMRLLLQQECWRFSEIVSKPERGDVSEQDRRRAVDTAMQYSVALEKKLYHVVLMKEEQVYRRFHVLIPEEFMPSKVRAGLVLVCLLDRRNAPYQGHIAWASAFDKPMLDCDVWAEFALDHALEEGDVCVFERLDGQSPPHGRHAFRIRVHIFRAEESHPARPAGEQAPILARPQHEIGEGSKQGHNSATKHYSAHYCEH